MSTDAAPAVTTATTSTPTTSAPPAPGAGANAAPATTPAASPGTAPDAGGGAPQPEGPSVDAPKPLAGHVVRDLFSKATTPQQAFDASKYQTVPEYHAALQAHERQTRFREGMVDAMLKPISVGDVTLSPFTSQEQVNDFLRFAGQKYNNVTPQDLLMLHRMKEMISLAQSSGARGATRQVQAATPPARTVTSNSPAKPAQPQGDSMFHSNGQVKSSRDLFAQMFPGEDPSKITQG